jgi:hypothetical protein
VKNWYNFLILLKHENSIIMLVSDHGLHAQLIYQMLNVENYQIEMTLPALFILIDKKLITDK